MIIIRSMRMLISASEKIVLMGAMAIIQAIKIAVGNPTKAI
jgi:hypothetical protein